MERKAIQLGLRGSVLSAYARNWIVRIEDISEFVRQRQNLKSGCVELLTPSETVYQVVDVNTASKLGLSDNTSYIPNSKAHLDLVKNPNSPSP